MPDPASSKTFLVLSQVYVPDPASVGQHMHDAAAEMARRGYHVVVLTSGRGYEDPSVKYARRETRDGVHIHRMPWSSFGKKSIAARLLGQSLFLIQIIFHGLFTRRLAGILVSTSPPMCSFAALWVRFFRRVPVKYWVMDLNPDQVIVLGKFKEKSLPVRAFNWLNRRILRSAADVIVLDRFMAGRVNAKRNVSSKLAVLPPWPHEDHLDPLPHDQNPFRAKHNLQNKFVFMYSGNMSIASPLTTVLHAGLRLQDDPRIFFLFIGGGLGKKEVADTIAQHQPRNMALLPYQPLADLRYSLSAADVHLVTLGDNMVGIIHPCKVYGAMAVARPVLFVGPSPSHIADILEKEHIGWHVAHGDVDGAIAMIQKIASSPPADLARTGQAARNAINTRFSKQTLCSAFGDVLERGITRPN